MTELEIKTILRKHLEQINQELKELDGQVFIIIYDTDDKIVRPTGFGCLACLKETLIEFVSRIGKVEHTKREQVH